jgi:hypothetical protein
VYYLLLLMGYLMRPLGTRCKQHGGWPAFLPTLLGPVARVMKSKTQPGADPNKGWWEIYTCSLSSPFKGV